MSEPSSVLRPERLSLLDGLSLTTTAEGLTAPLPAPDGCELRDFRVGSVKARLRVYVRRSSSPVTGCPAATDGLVFTSPTGVPLRHSNFRRRVWVPALRLLGLFGLHFQDLRHTGNQYASDAGASLREMMARMGHDSTRAAVIYQHSTSERQRAIADQVGRNARTALGKARRFGTRMARARRSQPAPADRQGSWPAQAGRPDRDSNAGPTA